LTEELVWAKQVTTGFSGGLYALACLGVLGSVVTLIAVKSQTPGTPAPQTPEKAKEMQAD
jgi:hypothetical protein